MSHIAPWLSRPKIIQMGLKSLKENEWLHKNDLKHLKGERLKQIKIKKNFLPIRYNEVFYASKKSYDPSFELFKILKDRNLFLPNKCNKKLHPLLSISKNIPEDLIILLKNKHGKWQLEAASLFFPSHWKLKDKRAKCLSKIHQTVPFYNSFLDKPVSNFFNNMRPNLISGRKNWTLQIDDKLFTPFRQKNIFLKTEDVPNRLFCREEYQAFRKLENSNAIIFSIRTHMTPLSFWIRDEFNCLKLINYLKEMNTEFRKYRSVDNYEKQLHEWYKIQFK